MTAPGTIDIDAVVADSERAVLLAAADGLRECLCTVQQDAWAVRLRFIEDGPPGSAQERRTVYLASLLREVDAKDSLEQIEQRWRGRIAQLDGSYESMFLCTVFRYVPAGTAAQGELTERVRRLNRLAAELSHDTGIAVIDLDRDFAHIGALTLGTDYRLADARGIAVAAHVIVIAMLAVGLDSTLPEGVRTQALQWHGKLSPRGDVVRGRLGETPGQTSALAGGGA